MIMLGKFVSGKIAVFIDAANIELSAKDLGFRIRYKNLYTWLESEGDLSYTGFYTVRFDTKEHDNFLTLVKKSGYKLVTKKLKLIKQKVGDRHLRKANFDVEIAVDAIRLIKSFQTIILFSGDSDFAYLLKYLRKKGKKIIVASLKHHISRELIESSDYYLDLRKIKKDIKL